MERRITILVKDSNILIEKMDKFKAGELIQIGEWLKQLVLSQDVVMKDISDTKGVSGNDNSNQ